MPGGATGRSSSSAAAARLGRIRTPCSLTGLGLESFAIMPSPDLCTEEDIARLVHAFYAKVRQDEALGPIFNAHVDDWPHHLAKLVDFWSALLRGTGRFDGAPMPKHVALPDLSAALFERWVALFRETAAEQDNQAMAREASELAGRIAQRLWAGYQFHRGGPQLV